MRRFDERTGFEMWVSDWPTSGTYEWAVIEGFDAYGSPVETASGAEETYEEAKKFASELYEQMTEVTG